MKLPPPHLAFIAFGLLSISASAGPVLFSDNFDAPDTGNLDLSDQTGRRSGLNPNIQVRSSRVQHGIASNQLNFLSAATGRIRFHNDLDNDNTTGETWYNWASGVTGAQILADGGYRVEFDWIAGNDSSANWVSINAGHNGDVGEPGFRVNDGSNDIGLLLRFNGQSELFDNGTNLGPQGNHTPTIGLRHVTVEYYFDSFADNTVVTMIAYVDGTEVYNGNPFTWSGNNNEFYMEIGTLEATLIDNLSISTVAPDGLDIAIDNDVFADLAQGDLVANLSATNADVAEDAVFVFVAGEGDTDNSKFQINGDRLEVGTYNFASDIGGTQYSVRIMGTGDISENTIEEIFILTLNLDSDNDGLPDAWELAFAADLTVLSGLAGADADDDQLTDAEEFALNPTADPNGVDPTNGDSDDDDLEDGAEIIAMTDPTDPDSDDDGLLDGAEAEVNGNPLNKDTDGDGWGDGLEVASGSLVNLNTSVPTFPAGVTVSAPITNDCSSGISSLVTYTHTVSGGDPAVINGINFSTLSDLEQPANFIWDASGGKNVVINNRGDWSAVLGGVTGPGMIGLLESFSYSGGGAEAGSTQAYTLSGLTPGNTYDLRLYIRIWSNLTTRFIDLSLTNGTEEIFATPDGGAPADRPSQVLMNGGSDNQAYFVNIKYTAQSDSVVLNANVPVTAEVNSGSFHFYGMSNELTDSTPLDFSITSISRVSNNPTAPATITFKSEPGATYAVDFSTSLTAEGQPGGWLNLDDSLPSSGTSTSYTDTFAATSGAPRVYYRVRKL